MRGRSFKTKPYTPRAVVVIMLLLSTLVFFVPQTTSEDFPEEDPPDPPPNTRPYLLEPPFGHIEIAEEFEWEGRVAVEDNDTVEWNITTNMTTDDYDEYEWYPDNYSVKLNIKCAQTFTRWFNVSVTDFTFPAAYWNWTVYCNQTGGTNFYWSGAGDAYQWDDYQNWLIESAGVYTSASAGEYPKDNGDQAFINETANTIYVQDGANSVLTIGQLEATSGFTGTLNLSVDMVFDNAGGHDGNLTITAGTYDTNGSANNQNNLDGNLTISATIDEQEGIFVVQGAQTQKIRVTNSQKLYKFTTDTASTVAELYDNLTAFQITIGTGSTYKADANTRGYELWTNFTDAATCGIVSTSSGTIDLDGASSGRGANMTTADAAPPPTNYWSMDVSTGDADFDMDFATLSYGKTADSEGTWDVENCTFDHFSTADWVVRFDSPITITNFNNNTLSNSQYSLRSAVSHADFYNIVISSMTSRDLTPWTGAKLEFRSSNFDTSKVVLQTSNVISKTHNDVANAYKIMATTLSKSTITNKHDSGDNIELVSGTYTVNEASASNDFTINSGATLDLDYGQTHTFDADANLTNSGVANLNGTITTGSGYFDFYNPGTIWLNNSTVSNADLNYYLGGFNFSVGNSANSTIYDWTLESPSGIDTAFNITNHNFNNKGSGTVWHMNVTASSGSVKFVTGNLTSGETYTSYVDSVYNTQGTADAGNFYNFSFSSWSTKHIYLTWESPTVYSSRITIEVAGGGEGQYDRWLIGFDYYKRPMTNEVEFYAVFQYKLNVSWYIWEFGDGSVIETDQPNVIHKYAWQFYSVHDVKLTVIATDNMRYSTSHDIVLDNSLWVGFVCLSVIAFAAIAIQRTRRRRQIEELVMVERE